MAPRGASRLPAQTSAATETGDPSMYIRKDTGERFERDYSALVDKPITSKMSDFHEWLQGVTGLKLDPRAVALGPTLYHDFQASKFNAERTEARRAAKVSSNGDGDGDGDGEEAAAPAPARRGRKPAAKTSDLPAGKPAARRGRKPAAATAAAPY